MANARRPKTPTESTRFGPGRSELCDWLDAAERLGGYDHALACLLALNGLRIGEICAANAEDLGETRYHHTLAVLGKGDKPALIPLEPRTRQALDQARAARTRGPLILSRWDARLTGQAGGRAVRRLARTAGITKHITPHSLHHSAITGVPASECGGRVGRKRTGGRRLAMELFCVLPVVMLRIVDWGAGKLPLE